MTTFYRFLIVLTVIAASAVTVRAEMPAEQACRRDCNLDKRDCVEDARGLALDCKLNCRETVAPRDLGECMRLCSSDFRTDHEGCRGVRVDCRSLCDSDGIATDGLGSDGPQNSGPDNGTHGQCVSQCAQGIGECARDLSSAARECRETTCAGLHGTDRADCVQQCADSVHAISTDCHAQFEDCVALCGAS